MADPDEGDDETQREQDAGRRQRDPDPVFETCPLCDFEGPRVAVYRHIDDDHPDVDPDDFFSDPVSELD